MRSGKKLFMMGLALVFALVVLHPVNVKAVETFTVYAQAPSDWEGPSLWAWSAAEGTNAFDSWPGAALEAVEGVDGWLSYEVPSSVDSVIINGNAGGVQTADLAIESKDVWVIVTAADSVEILYEAPAAFASVVEEVAEVEATEAPAEVVEEAAPEAITKTGETSNVWVYFACALIALAGVVFVQRKRA